MERMYVFQKLDRMNSFDESIEALHDWLKEVNETGNRHKARAVRSALVHFRRRKEDMVENTVTVWAEPDNNFD